MQQQSGHGSRSSSVPAAASPSSLGDNGNINLAGAKGLVAVGSSRSGIGMDLFASGGATSASGPIQIQPTMVSNPIAVNSLAFSSSPGKDRTPPTSGGSGKSTPIFGVPRIGHGGLDKGSCPPLEVVMKTAAPEVGDESEG